MGYLVAGTAFLLGLIKKNKTAVLIFVAACIFLLFGWSNGTADLKIFLNRFYNYESVSNTTEPVFNFLMQLFNTLGLEYQHFVIFLALVYSAGIVVVCKLVSHENVAFPAAMMILFPLCMDATQQRQTLGMCVAWIALLCLMKIKRKYLSCILFSVFCLLATLIHISFIVFFVCIFAKLFNSRTVIVITLIAIFVLFFLGPVFFRDIGFQIFAKEKVSRVFNMGLNYYGLNSVMSAYFRIFMIFLSFMVPYLYTKYMTVRTIDSTSVLICRLNIVILTILPFILFTVDFYRLQQTLILFNYCAISNWMVQPSLKKRYYVTINLKNTVYLWMTLFFAFLNLVLLVLRSSNINTVFRAFFEKNILL